MASDTRMILNILIGGGYENVYSKYQKRINKFRSEIKKKVCFFRAVNSDYELNYIKSNRDYIKRVITLKNAESNIVFLLTEGLEVSLYDSGFRYYVMHNRYSGATDELLRGWFDGNDEFMRYCCDNVDTYTMLNNILFDQGKKKIFN